MGMVDMVITTIWFSGPKSRSVNNSSQWPDFRHLALLVGLEASRPTCWEVWAEPPRKKGSYIAHVSVDLYKKVEKANYPGPASPAHRYSIFRT